MMFKSYITRNLSHHQIRLKHFIKKCPDPTYDTGCTFCKPPLEIQESLKQPNESIRNTVPSLNKIIIYLSNIKDNKSWPKKVESFDIMRSLSKVGRGNGNMIVLSSLSPRDPTLIDKEAGFLIFPDAKKLYINLQTSSKNDESFKELFKTINENKKLTTNEIFNVSPVERITILICGHEQRDKRCGVMGKLIHDEFINVLQHENLNNDIDLGYVSHVGGHVYAGNVIILKPDGTVIWYGLVKPQHVQGIVEKSVKDNQIIEQLSRQ